MNKKTSIFIPLFHRFIPQPALGRSSALSSLAAFLVLVLFYRVFPFTQFIFQNPNSGNTPQNPFGNGGEMPNFGGNMQFPQGGSSTQNNTLSYILLGVSVLLLAGGLIFAFKFKR